MHDMDSQDVLVNGGALNRGIIVSCRSELEQVNIEDGRFQLGCDELGKENLAVGVLEDLEEYLEDINDRLTISRMVNDSVIKGMVTAVEQEAAEKIASKELELVNLKEYLLSHGCGSGRSEDISFPWVEKASKIGDCGRFSYLPNACLEHEKMSEEVCALRNLAREQFKRAKKEVEFARTSDLTKRKASASELGLGEILQEKQPESCVDTMLEHLKETVDSVCQRVYDILHSSKISLCELQQEHLLSENLESMVIKSVLGRFQEEFEERLLEQNLQFFGIQSKNWLEKFNEISCLGAQLDAIVKSLTIPETGLVSHGSHDLDHLHHKAFNKLAQSTLLFGENGTLEASSIHVSESYDFHQLTHLSNVQLVDYFNNIITKLKRDHESALQQKTEAYFCLRREYLRERSSWTYRKDEEFDVLRKKIPEVVTKLENFLQENEKFPALSNSLEVLGKQRHRVESLLPENCHLRDSLSDLKNEDNCLEIQVSGTAAKLLQHSLSEKSMIKLIENLKSEVEDSHLEASLNEEIYKCALREQIAQRRREFEDSYMELLVIQEIYDILQEASIPAKTVIKYEYEDSDIESLLMQELSGIIVREVISDAGQKLNNLNQEVQIEKEAIISLETKYLEKENQLNLEVEETEKLKREILDLETDIKEKEKVAMDLSISLSKERERFEHASVEVCERNGEMELLRSQHLEAVEYIDVGKMEMEKLNQMLDQTKEMLMETKKDRNTALSLVQELQDKLLSREVREEKLKMEMKMAVNGLLQTFDDFQYRVSAAIKKNTSRMVNVVQITGLMYGKKLESRCADLQMAEAEVDLLGDDVDAMLGLLKKIYIALDHYSPVLKHYPGIIEILELVRRELSGGFTKLC